MTIRKGQQWGEAGTLAADGLVVDNDVDLTTALCPVEQAEDSVESAAEVGVVGGDLYRTLGSPTGGVDRLRTAAWRHPIDLGRVVLRHEDGTEDQRTFCAHVVAVEGGGPLFAARTVVVMNAAFVGPDNLGPRAHPNDGLFDLTDGQLGAWERIKAHRRMRTGTHVPHPLLSQRRGRQFEVEFAVPAPVRVDGADVGRALSIAVTCLPDAATVVA